MKYNGVKYHFRHGIHIGTSLDKIGPIIACFNENTSIDDVNRIIELYNICQIFNAGIRHKEWDDDFIKKLYETAQTIPKVLGIFFAKLNDENVNQIISNVSQQYIDDFWELFSKYKVFTRISPEVFISCLLHHKATLSDILKHKEIVNHYDIVLADYMRTSQKTAPILINKFLKKKEEGYHCYLPKTLLSEGIENIINQYIDSGNFSTNLLKLIYQGQSTKKFPISDKLRLKAKHTYEKYWSEHKNTMTVINWGINVGFIDQEKMAVLEENGGVQSISYNVKWFEQNLDYPTILNNFIYVFEMFDFYCRSTLVALESEISALEDMFMIKGINDYPIGHSFKFKANLSNLQIALYSDFLKKKNIDLEIIIKWFFEEYIVQEFGISGFCFQNSSENTTLIERNKNLTTEMDGVLKQFRMFVQDKQIDRELFEISSEQIHIAHIPSLIKHKYCYSANKEINNEMYSLFSDQSFLSWPSQKAIQHNKEYTTLFELLNKEKNIKISDFDEYQATCINSLITRGSLKLTKEKQYLEMDVIRVYFLKDLYENGCVCIYRRPYWQNLIDNMITSGDIREASTLFSEQESNYMNFELNKSEFSNGLDLRNKYAHSSYPRDEDQQKIDYFELLKLMILVVTKINDEFCFWIEKKRNVE